VTPDYRLTTGGRELTAALKDRLLSLRVRDVAGVENDTLELTLDDRAPHLELPDPGLALELALGYRPRLVSMGQWTIDEVGCAGWPAVATIRAVSADLKAGLKAPRERSWPDGTTLGALVQSLAGEHGYTPVIAAELSGVVLPHIDQTESDLHLLTRLAKEHDAVAKAAGTRLVCVKRGQAKAASGQPLAAVALAAADLTSFDLTLAERGKYPAVKAYWQNVGAAERVAVTAGSGTPVLNLRHTYASADSATRAAHARLAAVNRGAATLRLSCPGNPLLVAETRLTLTGLRAPAAGAWSVTAVTHVLDGSGYRCDIEAEQPEDEA